MREASCEDTLPPSPWPASRSSNSRCSSKFPAGRLGHRHRCRAASRPVAPVQLAGARALVTGATGGIGGAIARTLHARGAHVLLSGRREELLEELRASSGRARASSLPADLAERDGAARLADGGRAGGRAGGERGAPGQRPPRGLRARGDRPRARREPARPDAAHARATARDAPARPRARGPGVLAVGQGRLAPVGHLLGHQVRPARLRRRPA